MVAVGDQVTSGLWTEQRGGKPVKKKARLHKLVTRTVETVQFIHLLVTVAVGFGDSESLVGHQGILPILT
jgi:hypothetical protein